MREFSPRRLPVELFVAEEVLFVVKLTAADFFDLLHLFEFTVIVVKLIVPMVDFLELFKLSQ